MPAVKRKTPLRDARKADTEQRILDAATQRFLAEGYSATTLAAVASAAGVGERTVYVRFGTKADLLKRVIDVAIVGDTLDVDVVHRDWWIEATTAPMLDQRLRALARGSRGLMERAGPLFAVAAEAAPSEPVIAAAFQAGREASFGANRSFWESLRADQLIAEDVDLEWMITTTGLLTAGETYVLQRRTLRWDPATYERWLYTTLLHFATHSPRLSG